MLKHGIWLANRLQMNFPFAATIFPLLLPGPCDPVDPGQDDLHQQEEGGDRSSKRGTAAIR